MTALGGSWSHCLDSNLAFLMYSSLTSPISVMGITMACASWDVEEIVLGCSNVYEILSERGRQRDNDQELPSSSVLTSA